MPPAPPTPSDLRNINGSVEVTGYDGQEVRITARRTFARSASQTMPGLWTRWSWSWKRKGTA
ncbi:MAG: hypothetical protein U5K31_12790 [Balneolaceae bacterium]|nr:hypothetical protein [Balneolaceae bacterium]